MRILIQRVKEATVTICHSKTTNIEQITQKADFLFVACGKPLFVKKEAFTNHSGPYQPPPYKSGQGQGRGRTGPEAFTSGPCTESFHLSPVW